MHQVSVMSYSTITSSAFFISSLLIYYAFHTSSATNQNFLGSSDPWPLNTRIFIVFSIPNSKGGGGGWVGGGGGGGGGGVWGRGEGEGGVVRCWIPEVPCCIVYDAPLCVLGLLHSYSLSDSPNKGLYSLSTNLSWSTLNRFLFRVDLVKPLLNIEVKA